MRGAILSAAFALACAGAHGRAFGGAAPVIVNQAADAVVNYLKLEKPLGQGATREMALAALDTSADLAAVRLVVRLNGVACSAIEDLPVPAKPEPRLEVPRMNSCELAPRMTQFEAPLGAVGRGYNQVEMSVGEGGPQSVIWLEVLVDPSLGAASMGAERGGRTAGQSDDAMLSRTEDAVSGRRRMDNS